MTASNHTTRAVGLAALLVLSVVTGSIALVGVVAADEHGSAELPQDSLTEQRGDIVTLDVALNNTTTAYVSMAYEGEYGVLVEVVDGDEDGHVGLAVNTHYARINDIDAGIDLTDESKDAGDEFSIVAVDTPSEAGTAPLPTGTYDVAVGTELDGDALAEEQDTMSVTLEEGSVDGMRIWTAPYDPLAFDTRQEFFDKVGMDGLGSYVTETDRIAAGDYVVVQVDASGIYGQVSDRHDLTGVDGMGEETGLRLWIEEANPSATSDEVRRVDLTERENALIIDAANDTMYLLVDTHADAFVTDTVYEATFELNETNAMMADSDPDEMDSVSVSETFAIVERRATIATDGKLSRSANTTIRGTSSAAPGSQLTVELNGSVDALPMSKTVTVSDDGTYNTSFDLTDVPIGTNVTASVVWDDEVIGNETVVVVQQIDDDSATATPESTNESTTTATTTTTTAPTPTPEPTPEPTTTGDSATGGTDGGDGESGGATDTQSPGFGVVAAVVALLGAALLATRMRR